VVYIQGVFKVAGIYSGGGAKESEEVISRTIRSLEMKIRSIPGVVDVNFQLLNWRKEKGKWIKTK